MTIGIVLEFPGGDDEAQARIGEAVRAQFGDAPGPEGSLFHAEGKTVTGDWCMVEIWESREALARWQSGGLMAAMQQAGVPMRSPTHMTMFDVQQLSIVDH